MFAILPIRAGMARAMYWGALTGALLFVLVPVVEAQVVVRGDLFREITAKPGLIINLNIGVMNQGDGEATINLAQIDYTAGKSQAAGSSLRSLARWLTLPAERMTLAGKTQSEIKLQITVPETLKPGSYWSAVTIASEMMETTPATRARVGLRTVVIVQICVTIPGGTRNAQLGEPELKGTALKIPVIGVGDECFRVKVTAPDLPDKTIRVFPGVTRSLEYDISGLADGEHERRFLLDDGARFIVPVWIKFVKTPPPSVYLTALKAEEKRRRATLRGNVSAVLSYGSLQRGVSLQGSASFRFLRLWSGTDQLVYRDNLYQGYFSKVGVNLGPVSITGGRSWYGPIVLTTLGIGLNIRRLSLQASFIREYNLVTGTARWRVFRNVSVSAWGTAGVENGRRDWRFSLEVPII